MTDTSLSLEDKYFKLIPYKPVPGEYSFYIKCIEEKTVISEGTLKELALSKKKEAKKTLELLMPYSVQEEAKLKGFKLREIYSSIKNFYHMRENYFQESIQNTNL